MPLGGGTINMPTGPMADISHDDWASFWRHIDDYFSSGADNEIEDVLAYVTFPDPWPP